METAKVALFRTKYGNSVVCSALMEGEIDYVRISEYKLIEFKLLEDSAILRGQIKLIEDEIEKVKTEALNTIERLKEKKSELMKLSGS